jgi:hypothetical protein
MKQDNNQSKIISSRVFVTVFALLALTACAPENKSSLQTETSSAKLASNLLQEINNTNEIENQHTEAPALQEKKTTEAQAKPDPSHGEPEHKSDIAAGVPLNSSVTNYTAEPEKTTSAPPVTSTRQQTTGRVGPTIENARKLNSSKPVNYAPGTSLTRNPPHGQPGHRCDIPVGDPLPVATNSNVKLNPPHGQPGHRCDIAVGSPLPS